MTRNANSQHQARSEYFSTRRVDGKIATIFFQFDRRNLDGQDIQVIDQVIEHVRLRLRSQRNAFRIVGFTDQRGGVNYNRGLGMRRAAGVKRYMDDRLAQFENYSSRLESCGESTASRSSDQASMAQDRRVDIFRNSEAYVNRLEPTEIVGGHLVERLVKREWTKTTANNTARDDPRSGGESTRAFIAMMGGRRGMFESVWGREDIAAREFDYVFRRYAVNELIYDQIFQNELHGFADVATRTAVIRYKWGPPQSTVQILAVNFRVHDGVRRIVHKSRSTMTRAEFSEDPIFNPPVPRREARTNH